MEIETVTPPPHFQMRFRLQSGQTVELRDECADLSELFMTIQPDPITDCLDSLPESPKRKKYLEVLKRVVNDFPDRRNRLKTAADFRAREGELRDRCLAHVSPDGEGPAMMLSVLEAARTLVERLDDPPLPCLDFIPDPVLRLVIDFLEIRSQKRDPKMFEALPWLMQQYPDKVQDHIDPELRPYLTFIEGVKDRDALQLCRAAVLLGIRTLTQLVAYRFARIINRTSEAQVLAQYPIAEDLKVAVEEKLFQLLPWSKFSSQHSVYRTVIDTPIKMEEDEQKQDDGDGALDATPPPTQ